MGHSWSENRILTHLPAARQLYKAQNDSSVPFPPPRFLSIWISSICNLNCGYCFFSDSNHNPEKTFIKTDEILRWLKEMKDFGAEALEFSGGGSPTVHKDFEKIFLEAHKMGYVLGVITHGCNPMPLENVSKCFKYVRVGLDAASPEVHAAIKQKEGKFYKAIDNIKALVALRGDRKDFTVGIKIVLNSINFKEYRDVVWLAYELNVDYIQIKYEHSSDHHLTAEQLNEAQVFFNQEMSNPIHGGSKRTKVLGNLTHQKATTHCFMSPIHTVVDATGSILQCCFFDKRPIGTIRQPIREVWGGEQHRKVMAETTVEECDKVDCRFNYFNSKMKDVIDDPLAWASFI